MNRLGRILFATALATAWPLEAALAQALTPAEVATVKREVTEAVEAYYRHFSNENMAVMPEEVFHIPWVQIGGDEFRVDTNRTESLARFNESLASLKASGWGRSVYTVTQVCVMNARAAITSGYNTRYRTDGSEMSVGGVAYLFGKTADGWRIVSYTGIPRDRTIDCD